MAAIYPTPTYTLQTAHRVITLGEIAVDHYSDIPESAVGRIKHACMDARVASWRNLSRMRGFVEEATRGVIVDMKEIEGSDAHTRYFVEDTIKSNSRPAQAKEIAAVHGAAIILLFDRLGGIPWVSDHEARMRLTAKVLDVTLDWSPNLRAVSRIVLAWDAARYITNAALTSDGMGPAVTRKAEAYYRTLASELGRPNLHQARACHEFFENLETGAMPIYAKEELESARKVGDVATVDVSKLNMIKDVKYANGVFGEIYRIGGITILVSASERIAYVLDRASIAQMAVIARRVHQLRLCMIQRRVLPGQWEKEYCSSLAIGYNWLYRAIVASPNSTTVARHMKLSLALLQNDYHQNRSTGNPDIDASIKRGRLSRAEAIRRDMSVLTPLGVTRTWYDEVKHMPASDNDKLDIATLSFLVPGNDADPEILFDKTIKKMRETNRVDPAVAVEFLAYQKTFLASVYVNKTRGTANIVRTGGMADNEKGVAPQEFTSWVARAKSRYGHMPDRGHWGCIEVVGASEVPYDINSWDLGAKDVTHVNGDLNEYIAPGPYSYEQMIESIELLYVLKYDNKLSKEHLPSDIWDKVVQSRWDELPDAPVIIAAKDENTKPPESMRETWSAADWVREVLTKLDTMSASLSRYYNNIMLRKDEAEASIVYGDAFSDMSKGDTCIKVSLDVKGWSPNMNRSFMSRVHAVTLRACKGAEDISVASIMNLFTLIVNKRGVYKAEVITSGAFQGFTGTLDTIFHATVVYYCIRKLKMENLLDSTEAGHTLVLIDDAVFNIRLTLKRTHEDMAILWDRIYKCIVNVYASLGLCVEVSKTIVDPRNSVFLNTFRNGINIVISPLRMQMRMYKDAVTRYTTQDTQMGALFSTAAAAAARGACPIIMYMWAVWESANLVIRNCKKVSHHLRDFASWVEGAFRPPTMGGLGFPTIIGMICGEDTDSFLVWLDTMKRVYMHAHTEPARAAILSKVYEVLAAPKKRVRFSSFMQSPLTIHTTMAPTGMGTISSIVGASAMRIVGNNKYKEAMEVCISSEYDEALEDVLSRVIIDASALEALSQCLPINIIGTLTAKLEKNETVTCMLRLPERRAIGRAIRNYNKGQLGSIFYLRGDFAPEDFNLDDTLDIAYVHRRQWVYMHNMNLVNIVRPGPHHVLVHVEHSAMFTVKLSPWIPLESDRETSLWSSTKGPYVNAYDSVATSRPSKVAKSRGIHDPTSLSFRISSAEGRSLAVLLRIGSYISLGEGPVAGDMYLDVAAALWGLQRTRLPTPPVPASVARPERWNVDATKRIHTIRAFPNGQTAISVDIANSGQLFDRVNPTFDLAACISVAKARGLLELPYTDAKELRLSIRRTAFTCREPEVFRPYDPLMASLCKLRDPDSIDGWSETDAKEEVNAFRESLAFLAGTVPSSIAALWERAVNAAYIVLEQDDSKSLQKTQAARGMEVAKEARNVVRPHQRKAKHGNVNTDAASKTGNQKLTAVYRNWRKLVDPAEAAAMTFLVAAQTIYPVYGGACVDKVVWQDIYAGLAKQTEITPDQARKWYEQAVKALENAGARLDKWAIQSMVIHRGFAFVNDWANIEALPEADVIRVHYAVAAIVYRSRKGIYANTRLYRAAVTGSRPEMVRVHSTAARRYEVKDKKTVFYVGEPGQTRADVYLMSAQIVDESRSFPDNLDKYLAHVKTLSFLDRYKRNSPNCDKAVWAIDDTLSKIREAAIKFYRSDKRKPNDQLIRNAVDRLRFATGHLHTNVKGMMLNAIASCIEDIACAWTSVKSEVGPLLGTSSVLDAIDWGDVDQEGTDDDDDALLAVLHEVPGLVQPDAPPDNTSREAYAAAAAVMGDPVRAREILAGSPPTEAEESVASIMDASAIADALSALDNAPEDTDVA